MFESKKMGSNLSVITRYKNLLIPKVLALRVEVKDWRGSLKPLSLH